MSWKAGAHKAYEASVVGDALARLSKRLDLKTFPFSVEELHTLARRAREAFLSEKKRGRLDRYKAHLASLHGEERVHAISDALRDIHNEIGYEEK